MAARTLRNRHIHDHVATVVYDQSLQVCRNRGYRGHALQELGCRLKSCYSLIEHSLYLVHGVNTL